MRLEETYTERLFSGSIDQIRELHMSGLGTADIAEKVNLSEYLVKALIDRFVVTWDYYSNMPSPEFYTDDN